MPSSTPAPGWHPDRTNSEQLRWWDGQAWTEHTKPLGLTGSEHADVVGSGYGIVQPVAAKAGARRPWYLRWWAITAAVLVALMIMGTLLPDEETPGAEANSPEASAQEDVIAASPSPVSEPEPEPVDSDGDGVMDGDDFRPEDPKVKTQVDVDTDDDGVPDFTDDFPKNAKFSKDSDSDGVPDGLDDFPQDSERSKDTDGDAVADSEDAFPSDPSRSEITLAMDNALGAARDYLDFSAFSRQGLIDQLSSEYGSGFKVEDATWAVGQLDVDWRQQAVRSAKDYLDFSSFSRQGLIDQLSSSYGSQYTLEEATFAVNQIGL